MGMLPVSIRQRAWKFIADAWRFISDADTAVAVFGYVGFSVSPLIAAGLGAWAYFEGAPLPAIVIVFLLALFLLLAITYQSARLFDYFKGKRAEKLRERYLDVDSSEEKGFLDFVVEGQQALTDITKTIAQVGKETERLGRQIKRHSRRLNRTSDPTKQRKRVEAAANDMSMYSVKITELNEFMERVTKAFHQNFKEYISQATIKTDQEKEELEIFISSIENVREEVPKTQENLKGFRKTTMSLKGVSGQLNAASQRQAVAVGRIIGTINKLDAAFSELIRTGKQKIAEASV